MTECVYPPGNINLTAEKVKMETMLSIILVRFMHALVNLARITHAHALPCFAPELHEEAPGGAAGGAAAQHMQQPNLHRSQRAARAPRKHALAQHQGDEKRLALCRSQRGCLCAATTRPGTAPEG